MTQDQAAQLQLVRQARQQMHFLTGRQYQIKLELLDAASLRELLRLLRDFDHDKRAAARRSWHGRWP